MTNHITVLYFSLQLDLDELETSPLKPDLSKMDELGEVLRRKLKLDLFGVDVIIENGTQRYAVIDINVFPSMYCCLCFLICSRIGQ